MIHEITIYPKGATEIRICTPLQSGLHRSTTIMAALFSEYAEIQRIRFIQFATLASDRQRLRAEQAGNWLLLPQRPSPRTRPRT